MADQPNSDTSQTDLFGGAIETAENMRLIAERSQAVLAKYLEHQKQDGNAPLDPLNIGDAFMALTQKMLEDPQKLWEAQTQFWQDYVEMWQASVNRFWGGEADTRIDPAPDDRRFKAKAWSENAVFDFVKQSYLLTASHIQNAVRDVEGLDEDTARKVDFYTKQMVDAMAPTNFAATNPEVLRATFESRGENLVKGLENMLADLERGEGRLDISMTDRDAFSVGENIAVTDGKVIFQNDLIQLIQYEPTTDEVFRRPLLIIPPWINKYYILDLRPDNSFIRWAVEQGHTVFVVSWVNPDAKLAKKTFEDYMIEGPLAAFDVMEKITGEREMNVIGYCLGGTLLAATLAYLATKGDERIKSATYFTTLVDFREAGDLQVFIDDAQLEFLEEKMAEKGYLEGSDMATTFNMLRANDLIWSFVINNYLMGKEPFPFDLLYWNSDSTRMPAAMHTFYLRKMYQENKLIEPGGITLLDTPIDLGKVEIPTFILSTREDHIAPWKATYSGTWLYGGSVKFVLSGSGHIAGVVNPEGSEKYGYWTNSRKPKDPEKWLERGEHHPGSWWPEWQKWIKRFGGGKVEAREPGGGVMKPIEDAPGSYVKVSARD